MLVECQLGLPVCMPGGANLWSLEFHDWVWLPLFVIALSLVSWLPWGKLHLQWHENTGETVTTGSIYCPWLWVVVTLVDVWGRKLRFAFPEFPAVNRTSFSGISGNGDNLASWTQNIIQKGRKVITRNFRPIWFCSRNIRNFRLNGSYFGNWSISGFSENFRR